METFTFLFFLFCYMYKLHNSYFVFVVIFVNFVIWGFLYFVYICEGRGEGLCEGLCECLGEGLCWVRCRCLCKCLCDSSTGAQRRSQSLALRAGLPHAAASTIERAPQRHCRDHCSQERRDENVTLNVLYKAYKIYKHYKKYPKLQNMNYAIYRYYKMKKCL